MRIATRTTKTKATMMIVATIASGTKGSHAPESQTYVAKFSNV
jgi:hypothetical protein